MTENFDNSKIYNFLHQLASPLPAFSITTAEDQLLYLKHQSLTDIGTLPLCAELCHQYFPLRDGDIVITNDPYSGGHLPSTVMMIMGVNPTSTGSSQFYFCRKVMFKPKLKLVDSADQEGLRIPPTPIHQDGQLNEDLIRVIGENPYWPQDFFSRIKTAVAELKKMRLLFKKAKTLSGVNLGKSEIQSYLKWSQKRSHELLSDMPFGEFRGRSKVADKEFIQLRMEVNDGHVAFDFSGTTGSQHLHIPQTCTFGTCVGSVLSMLGSETPVNSGVLNNFELTSPQGTIVNAKSPQPVIQGLLDGPTILGNLVVQTLAKPSNQQHTAGVNASHCAFEIEFDEGLTFFDTLYPGSPGGTDRPGLDGADFWFPHTLEPSIEQIERIYPLQIKSYGFRNNSGGDGAFPGGNGIAKTVQVKSPGKLKWMLTDDQKAQGKDGGKASLPPEIVHNPNTDSKESLKWRGERPLEAGDTVTICSAGGGGFGDRPVDSK